MDDMPFSLHFFQDSHMRICTILVGSYYNTAHEACSTTESKVTIGEQFCR